MITKIATTYLLSKQANWFDDAKYKVKGAFGANSVGDHVSHYAGKFLDALRSLKDKKERIETDFPTVGPSKMDRAKILLNQLLGRKDYIL